MIKKLEIKPCRLGSRIRDMEADMMNLPWRLLEPKHHTVTAHFGTLSQCSVHPTLPKCAVAVWFLASNSLNGGQK